MGVLLAALAATGSNLGLVRALDPHFGQRALQHPNLHIVGDLDHELAIVLDLCHLADQSAGGHHCVAAADGFHHLLVGLNALLLRPDQKKIEDAKEQEQRHHGGNKGVVQIHFAISWGSFRRPSRNIAPRPSFATAASLGYAKPMTKEFARIEAFLERIAAALERRSPPTDTRADMAPATAD